MYVYNSGKFSLTPNQSGLQLRSHFNMQNRCAFYWQNEIQLNEILRNITSKEIRRNLEGEAMGIPCNHSRDVSYAVSQIFSNFVDLADSQTIVFITCLEDDVTYPVQLVLAFAKTAF